jgi:integral membrane protein
MSKEKYAIRLSTMTLRTFQIFAYAEGGLLPTILIVAVIHWMTGYGSLLVAVIGATHGMAFTAYILLVPVVGRLLHWPARTISVAFSVAFVPFATWTFERRIHNDISKRVRQGENSLASEV